jgi:hypothetical protein
VLELSSGRPENALEDLQKVPPGDGPEEPRRRFYLAAALARTGQRQEAETLLTELSAGQGKYAERAAEALEAGMAAVAGEEE